MKNILFTSVISIIFSFFYSCSSTKPFDAYADANSIDRSVIDFGDKEKTLSLKDFLIRYPNLYWANNRIMLRENSSILSQREPLYILDGVKIGNDYNSAASLIDPNDIKNVQILSNASETSFYGLDGYNGVILIKSKK